MAPPPRCSRQPCVLSNPLASALFPGTARVIVGLLGVVLLLLLVVERQHVKELTRRTLFKRWRTWAIIAPIYALAVLAGPVTTALLALGLALQGLREYASLVELPRPYRLTLLILGAAAAPAALISLDLFQALPPLLLLIATLQPLLVQDTSGVRHLAFSVLGWAYLAWLLSFSVVVRTYMVSGDGMLLTLGMAVALSDVGAFTVGSSVGRHP